jgi:hypothetical protein
MENTHEFKAVHDPLFCQEGDIPYTLEKPVQLPSPKFPNGKDIPANLLETDYVDRIVPPCNPDNSCEVIQDFLENENLKDYKSEPNSVIKEFLDKETDEIVMIKNQWNIAFKDRERLLTIISFISEQLKNAYADLEDVHKTISDLDERYYKYKQKDPQWQ